MPSNRAMPVEIRSGDAACSRVSEEIGRTEMPCSSMRNGYSLVPWVDPRYLTMRRRRVEISSRIRWSSRITQSETNSSMPCRVNLRHQPVQVEPQRSDILGQVWDRFLERHEHAGLAELGSAPNQELQSEQCLSGTGASTDKSGAAAWQPSPRGFVPSPDASRCPRPP